MIRLFACLFCALNLIIAVQCFIDVEKYTKEGNEKDNLNWNVEQHLHERVKRYDEVDSYSERFKEMHMNFTAARLAGGTNTDTTTYPWVALVKLGATVKGIAGIINMFWALSHTTVVSGGANDAAYTVYEGVSDTSSMGAAVARPVDRIIRYTNPTKSMALIRVCTAFTSYATLPAANTVFPASKTTTFLNYQSTAIINPRLQQGTKRVAAETCECEGISLYDPATTLCLEQSSSSNTNPATDVGSLLVIDGAFSGISIVIGGNNGEVYYNLAMFRTWISSTAIYL